MKKADISRDTLRHYTEIGLLLPQINERNGYREYTDDDVERISFIKSAQRIGFSLADIKKIALQMHTSPCKHQSLLPYLKGQLEDVKEKVDALQKVQKHLNFLIKDFKKKDCKVKPSALKL